MSNPLQSLVDAIKTLASRPAPVTSDALAGELEKAASESEADDLAKIHLRGWIKNKATLSKVMGRKEIAALISANKAVSKAEQNRVFEAELRQRGLPVFGESSVPHQVQELAPAQSAVFPVMPQTALPAVVSATALAVVVDAPLVATAAQFIRMSAADQSSFCMSAGTMLKSEFDKLPTPAAKMFFMRSGGKLSDLQTNSRKTGLEFETAERRELLRNPHRKNGQFEGNGRVIPRAEWDRMNPSERMEAMRGGATVGE